MLFKNEISLHFLDMDKIVKSHILLDTLKSFHLIMYLVFNCNVCLIFKAYLKLYFPYISTIIMPYHLTSARLTERLSRKYFSIWLLQKVHGYSQIGKRFASSRDKAHYCRFAIYFSHNSYFMITIGFN